MNTMSHENDRNLNTATNYYHAMAQKNFDAMASCLHPDVLFIGPPAEMSFKTAVVSAAKNLSQILKNIQIRAKFASNNQIMLGIRLYVT